MFVLTNVTYAHSDPVALPHNSAHTHTTSESRNAISLPGVSVCVFLGPQFVGSAKREIGTQEQLENTSK